MDDDDDVICLGRLLEVRAELATTGAAPKYSLGRSHDSFYTTICILLYELISYNTYMYLQNFKVSFHICFVFKYYVI